MFNNPYNFYPYMNNSINAMNSMGRIGAFGANGALNTAGRIARPSLFKGLSAIKWGSILNNTQKTLNVINQAIPVYYQIKPMWSNMKSFSRILTAFNSSDNNESTNNNHSNNSSNKNNFSNNQQKNYQRS